MIDPSINHREAYGFWLNKLGLLGEIAEIGCARGQFARTVLSQWQGNIYHMIDCWQPQDPKIYLENQETKDGYDQWRKDCELLAQQDKRVKLIADYSVSAAKLFSSNQLDAVYIDANHAYRSVMEDMDSWWPKIRIGGLMAGHDYMTRTNELGAWSEVESVVKRWAKEHEKVFYVCPCTSWFIHKQSE